MCEASHRVIFCTTPINTLSFEKVTDVLAKKHFVRMILDSDSINNTMALTNTLASWGCKWLSALFLSARIYGACVLAARGTAWPEVELFRPVSSTNTELRSVQQVQGNLS